MRWVENGKDDRCEGDDGGRVEQIRLLDYQISLLVSMLSSCQLRSRYADIRSDHVRAECCSCIMPGLCGWLSSGNVAIQGEILSTGFDEASTDGRLDTAASSDIRLDLGDLSRSL